jgi:hypothetical protein
MYSLSDCKWSQTHSLCAHFWIQWAEHTHIVCISVPCWYNMWPSVALLGGTKSVGRRIDNYLTHLTWLRYAKVVYLWLRQWVVWPMADRSSYCKWPQCHYVQCEQATHPNFWLVFFFQLVCEYSRISCTVVPSFSTCVNYKNWKLLSIS